MNGAELLVKALKESGVKYVFGYTGGVIMPFFDAMYKDSSLKHIQTRHEQGAVFMAQGLSRASLSIKNPQIGVAVSTSGPGAMNLVTGIADAVMDSTAIITLTGQVTTGVIGTDAFQETDVVGVMLPITKQSYMIDDTRKIEETVHEAKYIATTGRPGPVNIDIPKDVQLNKVDGEYNFMLKNYKPNLPGFKYHPIPDEEDIKNSIELINNSKRPVIFCGHGVKISNAGKELIKFAEMINAPIASTLHGISAIPSDHKLHVGWMGMHGSVEANRTIQNADLIISFGMRFDDRVTGKLDEYAKNADVIHIEIDPSEIDKNVKTTVGLNADVKEALKIFNASDKLKKVDREEWFEQIEAFKKETGKWHDEELKRGTGESGRLLMKTIITKLSEVTEGKDIVVTDVGQNQMMSAKYYNFQTPNSFITSGGAGTMGAGIPMGIGAKLARPDETVWVTVGDGGFQMNIQELGTIMEYDVDIKILLLNNENLGMVRQWQTLFFGKHYAGTPMKNPKFDKIAEAYGIKYKFVKEVKDIEESIIEAKSYKGAYIVEFACDSNEIVMPMIPANAKFEDMMVNLDSSQELGIRN